MEYRIVKSSIDTLDLQDKIKIALIDGWIPLGGPFVIHARETQWRNAQTTICQAIIREVKNCTKR